MRKALDLLYDGAGVLSGIFLVGIAVTIIAQVGGRMIGLTVDSTETAGFCLAASTFLGLAYTFRRGGHIRVTLAIRYAGPGLRRAIEAWCIAAAALLVGYFAWWAFDLVWFSWKFHEISPGLMAIPLWIPRLGMALGLTVFLIALLDELFTLLRHGGQPSYEENAETVLPVEEDETPGNPVAEGAR